MGTFPERAAEAVDFELLATAAACLSPALPAGERLHEANRHAVGDALDRPHRAQRRGRAT